MENVISSGQSKDDVIEAIGEHRGEDLNQVGPVEQVQVQEVESHQVDDVDLGEN